MEINGGKDIFIPILCAIIGSHSPATENVMADINLAIEYTGKILDVTIPGWDKKELNHDSE